MDINVLNHSIVQMQIDLYTVYLWTMYLPLAFEYCLHHFPIVQCDYSYRDLWTVYLYYTVDILFL